jgi:hypothetical protein
MTTLIMMDEDYSPAGIKRRIKEEFARHGIDSESDAAERYGRPQQWLNRRMTGDTKWNIGELEDFCRVLGISYVYVVSGIRPVPPNPPDGLGGGTGADVDNVVELKRRAPRDVPTRAEQSIDEDAAQYIALSETLLPRMDSNHQPPD